MKKYIGTKIVNAEQAWRINGVVYPKNGAVPKVMNREDGYKVVYEDGYESWSPKETFERAYKTIATKGEVKAYIEHVKQLILQMWQEE